MFEPVLSALADAVQRFAVADVAGLSGAEALAQVREVTTLVRRLEGVRLRLLSRVDQAGVARGLGATSTVQLLQAEGQAPGRAVRDVRLARKLAAHERVAEALDEGRVSPEQAEVIAAASEAMPAEVRARAESLLVEAAARMPAGELARQARRVAVDLDPGAAARLEREEAARRRRREFSLVAGKDGGYILLGRLDVEGAATVAAALDPLAAPRPATNAGPDPRTAAQRRGEALVELARRALAADTLPDAGGVRPRVVVTMTLAQLLGHDTGLARLDGGCLAEPVTPALARRIACDAGLLPAVLAGPSQVLDLGRERRLASPAQRAALALRDRGCAFPGCDRPPSWTDAHHIKSWAVGGRTDLDNLVLLCGPHHDLAHHGWTITPGPDRKPHFRPPARR
jgi:hypothetical protein